MRSWARLLLVVSGCGVIALAWLLVLPLIANNWIFAPLMIVCTIVGLDMILAGLVKRGPLLMGSLADLFWIST